jgi:site-specific DNA recombinase
MALRTPPKVKGTVVAYVRCSTEEQRASGLGVGAQVERVKAFCKATDRVLNEIVKDEGFSAKDLRRPGIQRILDGVKHRSIKTVLVYRLDRLTRNLGDLCVMMKDFDKLGVDLVSVSEAFDTSAAVGKLMLHMLGSFAEWERSIIAERTSAAITYARSQGKAYGPVPFGYYRSGDLLVRQPQQQRALGIMRGMRTTGYSFQKIADKLNELKVKPSRGKKWYASSVKAVLESRIASEVA